MSEETFLLCDGHDCSEAVKGSVALERGWWHLNAVQHSEEVPAASFEVDLCPECCAALFPDDDNEPGDV